MNTELSTATQGPSQMIPGDFAEKAMASLMQMHSELMDEKERRVELFRKLMEREQTVAELRMYIRLLEEKLEPKRPEPAVAAAPVRQPIAQPIPPPIAHPAAAAARAIGIELPSPQPTAHVRAPEVAPPLPPRVARPRVDGWKTW